MPAFIFNTNVAEDKIPDELLEELTDILQKMLKKPKKVR